MNIIEIIEKKRDKKELSKEEIEFFVGGYIKGTFADYQAAALIMAIFLNGMKEAETANLTLAMAHSGEVLDLSRLGKVIVDKHSTGGVGDKVSLILLPLVASLGVPVAKMSGRGLGFTGGTVDKLEAIPHYRTDIDIHSFEKNVERIGISMISQTANLAPADKKIYALRDSIGCVESIPLIASSIMSKKIASGADKIIIDVTVGSGAFMKTEEKAKELAREMISIGKSVNKETICVLTNMEEPLGYSIGNTLEVKEAIEFFRGNMQEDLKQVVLELGAYMIKLAGKGENIETNKELLLNNISNGKGYEKFIELIEKQGGDISYVKDTSKFKDAKYIEPVFLEKEGYINRINAEEVGKIVCALGAGRIEKDDKIDYSVGVVLNKKVGSKINKEEIFAKVYGNDLKKVEDAKIKLKEIVEIMDEKPKMINTIIDIVK